jgi:putative transposase
MIIGRDGPAHTDHCIAKEIVAYAKCSRLAIAVEDPMRIRVRAKARKAQRNRLHSWSFAQLRQFLAYKANLASLPMTVIDPNDTSRTCPESGVIDNANCKTRPMFSCTSCGHTAAADFITAGNIAVLARGAACNPALSSAPALSE